MMPRLSGEDVLDHLRDIGRLERMPVIILSAKNQRRDVEKGYERGATFYVVKPFNNTTIRELVRYLLDDDLSEDARDEILLNLMNRQPMM